MMLLWVQEKTVNGRR